MSTVALIADDDAGMRTTLTALLEDEGYEALTAADGIEALAVLEHTRPAIILLDLMMPRMDGYTLADELERRGLRPGIPMIVLTAAGRAQQKAERVGAEAGLEKPVSIVALLDEVERLTTSAPPR